MHHPNFQDPQLYPAKYGVMEIENLGKTGSLNLQVLMKSENYIYLDNMLSILCLGKFETCPPFYNRDPKVEESLEHIMCGWEQKWKNKHNIHKKV